MDYVDYRDSNAGVNIDLGKGIAKGGHAEGDTLVGIDGIYGSKFDDTLIGFDNSSKDPNDTYTNVIHGGDGNDFIDGRGGDDSLYGDAGDDTILGGDGNDYIEGGTGNDSLKGEAGHDTILGGDGDDYIDGGTGNDVLKGDAGNDTILGGEGDDYIDGGTGNDLLKGGAGNDTILGGDGDDIIDGGAGNDLLKGGAGNDVLVGGLGKDTMLGGDGNDLLVIGRGDDASGGNGNDYFWLDDSIDRDMVKDRDIYVDGGDNEAVSKDNPGDVLNLGKAEGWRNQKNMNDKGLWDGSGVVTLKDGTKVHYKNIEQVICLTPGAMILTTSGLRPVETLRAGDMVITRDNGPQAIRWIGNSTVSGQGAFAPVRLLQGAVPGLTADLLVSPQHRMLLQSFRSELMFGAREVLTAAKHMVDGTRAVIEEVEQVTYLHMIFDKHEVIFANGAPTESFHPASYSIGGLAEATREELFAIFPELRAMPDSYGQSARRVLKAYEAKALLAA
ncbi:Hint domain-containing protein [Falsirhodobacter halotolerans]|nr:Hint domain-containing protein [Falsirhodobacter halotolerans]